MLINATFLLYLIFTFFAFSLSLQLHSNSNFFHIFIHHRFIMRFSIIAAAFMLPLALAAPLAPQPPSVGAFVGLRGGFEIVSLATAEARNALIGVAPDPADARDVDFVSGNLNDATLGTAIEGLRASIVDQKGEPLDKEYVDTLSFIPIIDTLFTCTASLLPESRSERPRHVSIQSWSETGEVRILKML